MLSGFGVLEIHRFDWSAAVLVRGLLGEKTGDSQILVTFTAQTKCVPEPGSTRLSLSDQFAVVPQT